MIVIVASSPAGAAECAKREGIKGKWIAVTPSNFASVLTNLAVPRQQVLWNETTWAFPPAMIVAIGACIKRSRR